MGEVKEKGITLVALVVTIVVLLILAGITIVMLFGENGVINKAQNASVETKLGEIEEAAGLILADLNMKKYTDDKNTDTSISAIVAELGNKGYKIKTVTGAGGGITGITLENKENNNITLKPGDSIDIKVKFAGNTDGNEYYAVIEGKNYKITPKQGGINIAKEPSEISKTPVEEVLLASSNDSKVTVEVPNPKGNIVTITAGSEEVENVTVTINYGEEGKPAVAEKSITCTVKVETVKLSTDDIANIADKSSIYGKIVKGYSCTNSAAVANWKIFYVGNEFSTDNKNRIYLIADDYIERNKIPESTVTGGTGHALNPGSDSYPKAAYFTNILNDYKGSESITDERLKKLNNDYFSETKNYSSTNANMKAVAYMMDIDAWSVYKDNNKAEYAIGGPTVEMTLKSYSQKHNVDYRARAKDANGYEISKDGGTNWADNYNPMLDTSDTLYVLPSSNGANGIWLASPSAYRADYMMYVYYNGNVSNATDTYSGLAFRPLVCLNSNVQLEELSDGNYQIK